jgi:hypothetical protein
VAEDLRISSVSLHELYQNGADDFAPAFLKDRLDHKDFATLPGRGDISAATNFSAS